MFTPTATNRSASQLSNEPHQAFAKGKEEHARPIESISAESPQKTQTRGICIENQTWKWLKEKEKELPKAHDYYNLLNEVVVL